MEQTIQELLVSLQKLLSLHRPLLELVRAERTSLLEVDVQRIQDLSLQKQSLLDQISNAERDRVRHCLTLAACWNLNPTQATLSEIVLRTQAVSFKLSEQLRSVQQTLQLLISRTQEQNSANRILVEGSIERVETMKRNVLGEAAPKSSTYSPTGQRQGPGSGSRLLSTEI